MIKSSLCTYNFSFQANSNYIGELSFKLHLIERHIIEAYTFSFILVHILLLQVALKAKQRHLI